MDRPDRKTKRERRSPRVPIKTYKWEDINRSRKKGGYPWTYLYKQPFNEDLDPSEFTMEGLRKAKSTSTVGGKSYLTISEMTESDREGSVTPDVEKIDTPLQIITEPDDHSIEHSASSVVIEECDVSDKEHKRPEFTLDSAESSDDISQYLDKEDSHRGHYIKKPEENVDEKMQTDEKDKQDEDTSKRKRKMSAESSYSKISQTKSALLQKLKDTKNKIKIPKFSLPVSKIKKPMQKKLKSSPPVNKKERKKSNGQLKDTKPVYIHIPLKPPTGQSDEFSHFEFEEKSENSKTEIRKPGSFKNFVKNLKQLKETKEIKEDPNEEILDLREDLGSAENITVENLDLREQDMDVEPIKDILKTNAQEVPLIDKVIEKSKSEDIEEKEEKSENEIENITTVINTTNDTSTTIEEINPVESIENKTNIENISHITSELKSSDQEDLKSIQMEVEEIVETGTDTESPIISEGAKDDVFDHLFKVSSNKGKDELPEVSEERPFRSKSAEPEKKRKLSLESSYSRKSLSKLGLMKKIRDASDKIKSTLTRSNSKKESKPRIVAEVKKEAKKSKTLKPQKFADPVYIHIPLKPPEGEEDEFSHFVHEDIQSKVNIDDKEGETPSTPDSTLQGNAVQLIILTAPSDDETLDYHSSDVPETPSSEGGFFDKIDELKQLAKGAVEVISTPHTLEPVTEENGSDKSSLDETISSYQKEENSIEPKEETPENINEKVVDIEDGLSESKLRKPIELKEIKDETQESFPADTKENEDREIKSVLKAASSPVMRKKVSFKRRSKTPKDGSYEDIQAPELETNKEIIQPPPSFESVQIMPVDDEKSYPCDKTRNTTSLEEDSNKWSKISDHEYEPVNPPPDNITAVTPPIAVNSTIPVYTFKDDTDADILPLGDVPLDATPMMRSMVEANQNHRQDEPGQISPNVTFAPVSEDRPAASDKPKSTSSKFQMAFKQKTDDLKTKLHNIKRPNIHLPERPKFSKPNFQKFKIEKPKFNLPKMPDTTKINFPSFSLPRRDKAKRPLKQRQLSTESNAGDASDSKKPIFDFSTYPRIFKKKQKPPETSDETIPSFATVPRPKKTDSSREHESSKWSGSGSVRIPLHSEGSMEAAYIDDMSEETPKISYDEESIENTNPSHIRYKQDIDIDDEYERENNELPRDFMHRWDRGRFNPDQVDNRFQHPEKITDLDSPEEPPRGYDFNDNQTNNRENRDNYSSGSSHGAQMHSGVLEEINSDEFLWRQKGISEENMDIRLYLSTEIKEAFRTPTNALTRIDDEHDRHYNLRGSNQSLPDAPPKKKSMKKPKRKKTPHASQEQIPYTGESADDDLDAEPPSRPRRRSKRTRKPKQSDVIPYQETISVDISTPDAFKHRESLGGILGDDEGEEDSIMYENEQTRGKEQLVTDPYKEMEFVRGEKNVEIPAAPPRKHKSLKSLTASENDSILDDIASKLESEIEVITTDSKVIIPIQDEPPKRPSRSNSRTGSQSRGASQQDIASSSRRTDSFPVGSQVPCVEEPCIQDIRDSMGYAIIDKNRVRDPPLPPLRTLRRKRSLKADDKFFTVPRRYNDEMPMRPLRNYSTLTQVKKTIDTNTYENKENIDITDYVEIDDEPNKDLQSGEVIQKMKDRPLPAPPRPPRKSRLETRLLQDITSKENIMSDTDRYIEKPLEEMETGTQTEPLPDDFVCEEMIQEPTDTIIMASKNIEDKPMIEKRLITPTMFSFEETVTHGSLLVEPLNGAKILPDSELTSDTREKIIPVYKEYDFDETSSIPEDFHKLKEPLHPGESKNESSHISETEVIKTHKLQVTDLDIDTLTVHKLLADKILVSEIDSNSVSTNEISSKTGSLKLGEISLPPGVIEEIIKSIQASVPSHSESIQSNDVAVDNSIDEQKKTPMNVNYNETEIQHAPKQMKSIDNNDSHISKETLDPPITPPLSTNLETLETENPEHYLHQTNIYHSDSPTIMTDSELSNVETKVPPPRPPRNSEKSKSIYPPDQEESIVRSSYQEDSILGPSHKEQRMLEPEVDDQPPPRPPQPQLPYIPSQPPASFYALRAQKYVESLSENIPVVPRRRRHTRSRHRTRSTSEDSSEATPTSRHFHRRSSEPPISQLTVQLARACGTEINNSLKRLITYILKNVLGNEDGKQDLNVMIIIVLVLLTGLILLGYGDEKTVVHLHHWEYFNPPRDS